MLVSDTMDKLYSKRMYVHSSDGLNGVSEFPAVEVSQDCHLLLLGVKASRSFPGFV